MLKNALFFPLTKAKYEVIPWATFTDPELARVGMTEKQARDRYGDDIYVLKQNFADVDRAQAEGQTAGAPVDLADGFVHFSTAAQLPETLAKHFAGEEGLTLLACEAEAMGSELRWEPSRGGQDFPHLYRMLRMDDLIWSRAVPLGPEGHQTGVLE